MKKILFTASLVLAFLSLQGQSSDTTTVFEKWTSSIQEVITGPTAGNELGLEDIPIIIGMKYISIGTRQLEYRSAQYFPADGSMIYQGSSWNAVLGYYPEERRFIFYFFEQGECPVRHYLR